MRFSVRISVRLVIWTTCWTISYFVLLGIFASSSKWQSVDYVYTFFFIITLMGAVVTTDYWRRRLFARKQYALWLLTALVTALVFAEFNDIMFSRLIDYVFPGYYF